MTPLKTTFLSCLRAIGESLSSCKNCEAIFGLLKLVYQCIYDDISRSILKNDSKKLEDKIISFVC